jgi:hypothetical protein
VTEATSELLARELLAKELRECLVRLPEDRTRWTRRAGELLEEDRQSFVEQAVEIVCQQSIPPESEKALLSLLIGKGYLLPVLLGVYSTDRIRFREVLSTVQAVEPRFHARITKRLTELLDQDKLDRVDEVLCLFDSVVQMNGMANLASALPLLKDAKDPRLRARAALLDASLPNGRHLLELYRDERDPRVRASILESLWLSDQPIARLVFEEARRDLQPRVRSYGLLGLYRIGDPRALTALAEMAESRQALSRAVARGAIELLHEPRFEPILMRLRMEFGDLPVRHEPISPAVRCGRRSIHLAVPRVQRLPPGRLSVQFSARLDEEERLEPVLRPLDVRTWVDDQPVLSYSLVRVAPARRLGIGVVFPLSLRAASESTPGIRRVLDLLLSMPDGELRSAGFYRSGLFMRQVQQEDEEGPSPSAPPGSAPLRLPVISQDGFRFAADLKDSSRESSLAADPGELILAMLNRLKVLKPAGHIALMLNAAAQGPPKSSIVESLRQGLQESGCALHVIAHGQVAPEVFTPWCALSRECGGFQTRIPTEDELPGVIRSWMLCFRESYCLEFEAPASASHIRIQAIHPTGAGEIAVALEVEQTPQCAPVG